MCPVPDLGYLTLGTTPHSVPCLVPCPVSNSLVVRPVQAHSGVCPSSSSLFLSFSPQRTTKRKVHRSNGQVRGLLSLLSQTLIFCIFAFRWRLLAHADLLALLLLLPVHSSLRQLQSSYAVRATACRSLHTTHHPNARPQPTCRSNERDLAQPLSRSSFLFRRESSRHRLQFCLAF